MKGPVDLAFLGKSLSNRWLPMAAPTLTYSGLESES